MMLKKIKKFPFVLTWLFYVILRLYSFFLRKRFIDVNGIVARRKFPVVTVTWHNRILCFPLMFSRDVRERTCAVVSASRDGEYLADLLRCFGVKAVRGSSKKKAISALSESMRMIEEGINVCFTPDGPRGPKYKMSQGPIVVASKMAVPIVPLAINYSKYWELRTWDSFRIPKPFSTVTAHLGEEINIPSNLTDEEILHWMNIVEEKLNAISEL